MSNLQNAVMLECTTVGVKNAAQTFSADEILGLVNTCQQLYWRKNILTLVALSKMKLKPKQKLIKYLEITGPQSYHVITHYFNPRTVESLIKSGTLLATDKMRTIEDTQDIEFYTEISLSK
jgi:hypothetical protein